MNWSRPNGLCKKALISGISLCALCNRMDFIYWKAKTQMERELCIDFDRQTVDECLRFIGRYGRLRVHIIILYCMEHGCGQGMGKGQGMRRSSAWTFDDFPTWAEELWLCGLLASLASLLQWMNEWVNEWKIAWDNLCRIQFNFTTIAAATKKQKKPFLCATKNFQNFSLWHCLTTDRQRDKRTDRQKSDNARVLQAENKWAFYKIIDDWLTQTPVLLVLAAIIFMPLEHTHAHSHMHTHTCTRTRTLKHILH